MNKVTIVAEACCNHMGNMEIAKKMIKEAKINGADYVKFQKRDITTWCNKKPEVYESPHPNDENSFGDTYKKHRENLEFNIEQHKILKKYCESIGIEYCCTPFDLISMEQIISLNPNMIKIASACNLNFDLLNYMCDHFNGEIHLSLGMTRKNDIEKIVTFFEKKRKNKNLIIYACTSNYPLELKDVCILEVKYLSEKYNTRVKAIGFSGHHEGIIVDCAAVSLGAKYLERHFTLNKNFKGTDQGASILPTELKKLVENVSIITQCLTYKKDDILDVEYSNKEKLKWETNI